MRLWAVAVFMLGCSPMVPCDVPGSNPEITAWDRMPTIGLKEGSEHLYNEVGEAIDMWGWGWFIGDCNDVDICIEYVFPKPTQSNSLGYALQSRGTKFCRIVMYTDRIATVAHELGHCYGIGHLDDEKAIMHALSSPGREMTQRDLDTLHAINNQCLGF